MAPIAGAIRWSEPAAAAPRAVLTSLAEVANGATVSLIDPSGGQTVATTVTTPEGRFSLDLTGWAPVRDAPYVLEAIKGLGLGGKANRAGAPLARLRTIVQLSGASWTSFTGPAVVISRSTTALAALTGLNQLSTAQIRDLAGTIQSGSPDAYSPTAAVSAADYQAVWGLVDASLALNQDAIRAIARSPKDGSYVRIERAPVVTDVSALSGGPGDVVVIHGSGFDPTAASNFVRFGGVLASEIRVDAAGTRLEATVPAGARSGDLAIQVGNLATRVPGDFQFQPAYTELAVEPNILDPGGTAAVTGPGLPTASDFAVTLNDIPVATWSLQVPGSRFTFVLPAGASTGYLRFRAPFSAEVIGPLVKVRGTVGTLAGTGSWGHRDGMGPEALFGALNSIALDAAGNLYVGDYNQRIRKISRFGQVSTFAGNGQRGARDGIGTEAQFDYPGAFSDSTGQLYVRNAAGGRICRLGLDGKVETILGSNELTATTDQVAFAFNSAGLLKIIVPDKYSNAIYEVTPGGEVSAGRACSCERRGVGGSGVRLLQSLGYSPSGAALELANGLFTGSLVVSDPGSRRIRKIDTTTGSVLTPPVELVYPGYVTIGPDGNYYGTEPFGWNRVWRVTPEGTAAFWGAGPQPDGIAVDAQGTIYVSHQEYRVSVIVP